MVARGNFLNEHVTPLLKIITVFHNFQNMAPFSSTNKALSNLTPSYLFSSSPTVPPSSAYVPTQQTPSLSPEESSQAHLLSEHSLTQVQVECPNTGFPSQPVCNNVLHLTAGIESDSSISVAWIKAYDKWVYIKEMNEYFSCSCSKMPTNISNSFRNYPLLDESQLVW